MPLNLIRYKIELDKDIGDYSVEVVAKDKKQAWAKFREQYFKQSPLKPNPNDYTVKEIGKVPEREAHMNKDLVAKELIKIAKLLVQADDLSPKQEEYQEHFRDTMEEHDIESPAELDSEEDKKDFFDAVDEGWNAESE